MSGHELVVGVAGGVAAYKSAALVSQLVSVGKASDGRNDALGQPLHRRGNFSSFDWSGGS